MLLTDAALAVIFGLFGLVIGSFLTVVAYRVPRKESLVRPNSRCPACGAPIKPIHNIPVISWLLLRGRCASCKVKISARYPAIEAATGGLFVLAFIAFPADLFLAAQVALFFAVLFAVSLIDLETMKIPNRIVYPAVVGATVLVVAGWLLGTGQRPLWGLIGMLAFGGGLLVVVLVYPKGMGMGDVKLAALIGLVLGSIGGGRLTVGAFAAFVLGGLAAIAVLAVSGGENKKMPFGPFLAAGAVVGTMAGPALAAWYSGLLSTAG